MVDAEDLWQLFQRTNDLIAIIGFDGKVHALSPSWESLGWPVEELIQTPLTGLIHPDDLESSLAEGERVMTERQASQGFRNRYRCKDGSYRMLEWSAYPDDRRERFYTIARDVTLMASQEQSLTQHSEDLEAFAFMLAHDVRSPLRAVASLLGVLHRRKAAPRDDIEEILHMAIDRIRTADEMAGSLLAYARMGDDSLTVTDVDMQGIAGDIIAMFAETGQRVDHVEIQELPPCRGDATLLREALTNLVQNAIRHSEGPDGKVIVSGEHVDGAARYSVHDNGTGVAIQDVERIWEPLARGRQGGTGLGLAIVRRIARAHGGTVACDSGIGRGATFSFDIPV